MNETRRTLLIAGACLSAGASARAQLKSGDNPEASENWKKVRAGLFGTRPIAAAGDDLKLDAPARAEDAAIVPIAVSSRLAQSAQRYVEKLYIVIDNNPSPIAAVFAFTPDSGRADIETRVRVDEYTFVRAIAETNDGKLSMTTRFVKASGGCSAPPGKDQAAALATLGKMRLRLDGEPSPGKPVLAQLMISHPNNSGLAMDQFTRQFTPAHYVRKVDVSYRGKPVMSADVDFSISENPNFRFWFVPGGEGELKAEILDTRDLTFQTVLAVRPVSWRQAAAAIGLAAALASAAAASPAEAAPFAYITNQGSHDVSVIDVAARQVVATVPVGRSPAGVVAVPAAGRVVVSNPDSKTLSVIDMRSRAVVAHWPAGSGPVGLDASADGRRLAVADWYADRLLVYDLDERSPAPRAVPVGRAPAGVAVAGTLAFVAERDDDSVAVVDLADSRVRARVRVGSHPFALLHDAGRRRVYALNVQSDDVSVIDVRDADAPKVIATVAVGKAPYGAALADAGALLYVTNQHADTVSVIDAERLRTVRTLDGFGYPEGIAAHGAEVWVVNWMDDNVAVLDARTGSRLATIPTGRNPRGFGAFIGEPAASRSQP